MEFLKTFIDGLPTDKLRHLALGEFINPIVIIVFLVLGALVQGFLLNISFIWFGYVGVLVCCYFHYRIEVWQKKTNSGQYELADAFAGSFSALTIGFGSALVSYGESSRCCELSCHFSY